ncbi:MAG TPA: hypothetical protein VMH83_02020 [Candidatus Acidoferrum sp.]|nr:hypothetical protein [Candidatus Acidoferrum sp.]
MAKSDKFPKSLAKSRWDKKNKTPALRGFCFFMADHLMVVNITDPHVGLQLIFGQATDTAIFVPTKVSLAAGAGFQQYETRSPRRDKEDTRRSLGSLQPPQCDPKWKQ